MNRNQFLPLKFLSLLFLLCVSIQVSAQTDEVQKIEVGTPLHFTY